MHPLEECSCIKMAKVKKKGSYKPIQLQRERRHITKA